MLPPVASIFHYSCYFQYGSISNITAITSSMFYLQYYSSYFQ